MLLPLDGPSVQTTLAVTVQVEVKVGATALNERKIITIQPKDGKIWLSFVSGQDGFLIFKNQLISVESSEQNPIYIKAFTGTVNVVIAERA